MPHRTTIDESVDCYFIEWSGTVEADEWQAWFREIANFPWFRKGLNGLHDLRHAQIRLGRSKSWMVADILQKTNSMFGAGRVVHLVADQMNYALLQSYFSVTNTPERTRKVFTSYEDAKAWLGLPTNYVGSLDRPEGATE